MFPSIPYNVTHRFVVTTNANGSAAFAVTPSLRNSSISPSVAVTADGTADWTSPTTQSVTHYSSITPLFDLFRHAAWGVRIIATSSVSYTAGTLYCCYVPNLFTNNSGLPQFLPNDPDNIMQLPWSSMYPCTELNAEPIILPAKRVDPGSLRFRNVEWPPAVTPAIENSDGWGSFVFIVVGASAANPTNFTVEVVYRDEMIPQSNASVINTGTSYPTNTQIMDRTANIQSVLPLSYVEQDSPSFVSSLITEAESRLRNAWSRNRGTLAKIAVAGAAHVGRAVASNWVSNYSSNRPRLHL